MLEKIKSLKQVAEETNETLGEIKKFNVQNGYRPPSIRGAGSLRVVDTKLKVELSMKDKDSEQRRFGLFKSKRGYNSKYKTSKQTANYANHYGEYLAYIILKQLGKDVCKVDLGNLEIINSYSKKLAIVEGCLSHYELEENETVELICIILESYKNAHPKKYRELTQRGKTNSNQNNTNIELILKSLEEVCKQNGQEYKIPDIRKSFFDMCIFDIKFANRDRHDDNFGLKINQENEIEFYSLFDNEQILGLQEEKQYVTKYLSNPKEYEKFKNKELTSCIGIPGKIQQIKPMELLEYLLENYPEETQDSLKDIGRYTISNLEETLEICPGLSEEHKQLAKKIFLEREKEIEETVKAFNEKQSLKTIDDGPDL